MSDLAGKVVAVTGAETGIGRAIAMRCAADGAAVVAAGIDEEPLRSLEAEAAAAGLGTRLAVRHTDVRDRAAIDAMIDDATARFGRLDAAVANAGVFVTQAPITEWSRDEWDEVVAVNLTGVFETLQAAARVLVRQGEGGSLLATTSSNALRPRPQALPYVASKGAAHQMVRALAIELARHRIRVNAIVPGLTRTPGTENRPGHIERGIKSVPMGEITMPEEIAALVAFAISDAAPHMTGAELKIDGGRTSG